MKPPQVLLDLQSDGRSVFAEGDEYSTMKMFRWLVAVWHESNGVFSSKSAPQNFGLPVLFATRSRLK